MSSNALITGSMEYLRKPLVRNVKAGDRALVVTDTAHDPRVWQAVMSILQEIGADVTVALFERRPADYYDPPAAVCEAFVDVLAPAAGRLHDAVHGDECGDDQCAHDAAFRVRNLPASVGTPGPPGTHRPPRGRGRPWAPSGGR